MYTIEEASFIVNGFHWEGLLSIDGHITENMVIPPGTILSEEQARDAVLEYIMDTYTLPSFGEWIDQGTMLRFITIQKGSAGKVTFLCMAKSLKQVLLNRWLICDAHKFLSANLEEESNTQVSFLPRAPILSRFNSSTITFSALSFRFRSG